MKKLFLKKVETGIWNEDPSRPFRLQSWRRKSVRVYLGSVDGIGEVPIGRHEEIAAFGHFATGLQKN